MAGNNTAPTVPLVEIGIDDRIFSSINEVQRNSVGKARDSIDWLKGSIKDMFGGKPELLEGAGNKFPTNADRAFMTTKFDVRSIGRMFMYIYDPKHKATLPYYDTVPLVILVDLTKDGFTGLNLHYVPPFVRAKIIEALQSNMNKTGITDKTRAKMNYEILKRSSRFNIIKPCFKRYLASNVRSSFMYIDPLEWDKAILLPTEKFKKKDKIAIYQDFVKGNLRNK